MGSLTRNWTCVPCITGWILNHWARGSLIFDFLSHSFLSTEARYVPWEVWILSLPHSSLGMSQASSAASICRHQSLLVTVSRKRSFPLMISHLLCVISASHPQGVLRPRGGKRTHTHTHTHTHPHQCAFSGLLTLCLNCGQFIWA